MKVTSIQPTPNPNAFKFLMDKPMAQPGQTQAYAKPEQAKDDALAQAMFAVQGVETLFFCDNFVTVSMTAEADWRAVAEQVTKLLESHEPEEVEAAPPPAAPAPPSVKRRSSSSSLSLSSGGGVSGSMNNRSRVGGGQP